jgi:uncharacterized protein (DUF934 family)
MPVIVTDSGFHPEDWTAPITPLADLAANDDAAVVAIDLASTDDPGPLQPRIARIDLIRITAAAMGDGRAFTLARRLRGMGYQGRLRAAGPLIADQYAMARRSGFDEVEISDTLAARQPAEQWQFRAHWRDHDYQARLRAS